MSKYVEDSWSTKHFELLAAERDRCKAERDRYREAMRAIGELPWCGTCAPGYNAIVSAALDG